jgi:MacB-like periplasmic core domain
VWIWQDVRHAARALRHSPAFTTVTVLILAIGIGSNSAMFSLVDAALVRPLPFNHPAELVMLWERPPRAVQNRVSPLNFLDWSEQQHSFSSMAAIAGGGRTLTGTAGTAERIPSQAVTPRFFEVLGVRTILGRTFDPTELIRQPKVVVISEAAVAVLLLSGAGLLVRTLIAIHEIDPGFRADHVRSTAGTSARASKSSAISRSKAHGCAAPII